MVNHTIADARMAAQVLHARLGTDYDKPIDVFRTVQQEGIWLASQPLDAGLYGFYLRQGDATGIVLNKNHPEQLQRYTCAHELGHHVLGHASHLDDEDDVLKPTAASKANETAAQAFAGVFLMPLQAVNRVMHRLGFTKDRRLDASDVYQISRELDVSFSAAAWQLAGLRRIHSQDADRWARQGAAAAKNSMRPGPPPEGDNRAALYILDSRDREIPILCRPGDELRLRLPEDASTGHVWRIVASSNTPVAARFSWDGGETVEREPTPDTHERSAELLERGALRLARQNYLTDGAAELQQAQTAVGRQGIREFVFVANQPGRTAMDLRLSRPWETNEVADFRTVVRVGPAHVLDGFAHDQAQAHIARVAGG